MKFEQETEFDMLCDVEQAVMDAYFDNTQAPCRIFKIKIERAYDKPVQDLVKITLNNFPYINCVGEVRDALKYEYKENIIWADAHKVYEYLRDLGMHEEGNEYEKVFTFFLDLNKYKTMWDLNNAMSELFDKIDDILIDSLNAKEANIEKRIREEKAQNEEFMKKYTLNL